MISSDTEERIVLLAHRPHLGKEPARGGWEERGRRGGRVRMSRRGGIKEKVGRRGREKGEG